MQLIRGTRPPFCQCVKGLTSPHLTCSFLFRDTTARIHLGSNCLLYEASILNHTLQSRSTPAISPSPSQPTSKMSPAESVPKINVVDENNLPAPPPRIEVTQPRVSPPMGKMHPHDTSGFRLRRKANSRA